MRMVFTNAPCVHASACATLAGVLQVYRGMMDLCVSKFKESEGLYVGPKEAGYCLLRSQLLMAFHDNAAFRHLANEVSSHALLCLRSNAEVWRFMLTFTCAWCMLHGCKDGCCGINRCMKPNHVFGWPHSLDTALRLSLSSIHRHALCSIPACHCLVMFQCRSSISSAKVVKGHP